MNKDIIKLIKAGASIGEISNTIFQSMVSSPKHLIFVSIILTVIAILVFKAIASKNTYENKINSLNKKFVPSGQTALAFAILTSIWLNTRSILIFSLALMLSLMVFENRIESKIHSIAESIFGSFMGVLIVLLVYGLTLL